MKIWIGFSTTNNVISRVIRWFTRSTTSHAWLAFTSQDMGMDIVLEAHFTFRAVPYAWFKKRNRIVAEYEIPVGQAAIVKCASFLGENYDYTGIVGGIIVSVGRWFKHKWHNPWGNPKAQTCSEAVVRALQAAAYPGAEKLNAEDTSPQTLMEFLAGNG